MRTEFATISNHHTGIASNGTSFAARRNCSCRIAQVGQNDGRQTTITDRYPRQDQTHLPRRRCLARCRYRDTDGVTRVVQKLGPADEYDKYGKLAEDALMAVLAERKRAGVQGEIGPDTKVAELVEQHLARLAEDGRSPVTMSTYRFTNTKLKKFVGDLRVHEATPARMDAALRSMRNAHGATMARQSKSILRGALKLAVMASVINANPVRDVQPVRSKSRPKGAVALTADQLRDLLVKRQTSEFCEKHDLVDPITLLIATGIRRSELLGLRWSDFDEKTGMLTVAGKVIRVPGEGLLRVDETKSVAGRRTIPLPRFAVEMLQKRRHLPYLGEQTRDLPVHRRHPSRPEQLPEVVTLGQRGARRPGRNHRQLPQDGRHTHRRRRSFSQDRRRPPWPHPRQHDPGSLYDPRPNPHPSRRPAGSHSPHKR